MLLAGLGAAALALCAAVKAAESPGESLQVYVSGRPIVFATAQERGGQPVVATTDPGLAELVALIGGRLQYEPGTRFVVFTRADGTLITLTAGSNALTVDDASTALTVSPFTAEGKLYVPLLPLAAALGLHIHAFRGGYAMSPEITALRRYTSARRTVIEVQATAPLSWRSSFIGPPGRRTLTLTFAGFANAASPATVGGLAKKAGATRTSGPAKQAPSGPSEPGIEGLSQSGAPGFPMTTLSLRAAKGWLAAVHRISCCSLDVVIARSPKDLVLRAPQPSPAVVTAVRPVTPSPPSAAPGGSAQPQGSLPSTGHAGVATAAPAPEVTDVESPQAGNVSPETLPSSESPPPGPSGAPSQTEGVAKVMSVSVASAPGVGRIVLSVTGPVSFVWHRLAAPDNRIWIDIYQAELVGPAQDLTLPLPEVRAARISQHELTPDHVVRVAIDPTQPVDFAIGAIQGAPNELGIDVRSSPPPPDAPTSGMGGLVTTVPQSSPVPAAVAPTDPRLIVIDPGHGGNDPGAMNQSAGLVESHLTLSIARRVQALLMRDGWRVTLTRDGDYEVGDPNGDDKQELQARCDVANAAGARLFISIHINASVSSTPDGMTTYYWRPSDRAFAQSIQQALVAATGDTDDGVKRDNFYVIHHTVMPAVLVEAGYLSNSHDAALLEQPAFLERIAEGIARGVNDFTGGPPR
jgi:N-acetylmuramoyl-L-alanine amidase